MKEKNIYSAIVLVISILSVVNLAEIIYRHFDSPAILYTQLPIPLEKEIYKPGDYVDMEFSYCVRRSTRYSVSQRLINMTTKEEFNLPSFTVNIKKGEFYGDTGVTDAVSDCRNAHGVPKQIPEDATPGIYKFVFTGFSDGKYGGVIEYRYESETFIIPDDTNLAE